MKKWYLSKTIWTNLFVSVVGAAMTAMGYSNMADLFSEGNVMMLIGVVNIVLRMVTKEKLEIA